MEAGDGVKRVRAVGSERSLARWWPGWYLAKLFDRRMQMVEGRGGSHVMCVIEQCSHLPEEAEEGEVERIG